MVKITAILLLALAGVGIGPTSSEAVPILTFAYEGTVDRALGGAAFEAFLGETMRIKYTFDGATPDTEASPNIGNYAGAVSSLTLTVGADTYSDAIAGITVYDDRLGVDQYAIVTTVTGPTVGGFVPHLGAITLQTTVLSTFTSDALPLTPPDPSRFTNTLPLYPPLLWLDFVDPIDFRPVGEIAVRANLAIVPTSVPEPSTVVLMGLGLFGLGYAGRRKLVG